MNWLDVWLAVIVVVSTVAGLGKGFARTGIAFIASVLGLVVGLNYYRQVGLSLRPYIHQTGHANLAGFLIIFFGFTILGSVISGILIRWVRAAHLSGVDRLVGGAFGIVRGMLWATVTIWALMAFVPASSLLISNSRLAPFVMDAARRVADASPDEVKESFRHSYRELNKVLPEKIKEHMQAAPPGRI